MRGSCVSVMMVFVAGCGWGGPPSSTDPTATPPTRPAPTAAPSTASPDLAADMKAVLDMATRGADQQAAEEPAKSAARAKELEAKKAGGNFLTADEDVGLSSWESAKKTAIVTPRLVNELHAGGFPDFAFAISVKEARANKNLTNALMSGVASRARAGRVNIEREAKWLLSSWATAGAMTTTGLLAMHLQAHYDGKPLGIDAPLDEAKRQAFDRIVRGPTP